jgi:hypothetical protein
MTEIWKDVIGYENLYQVSNLGRVKSLGNGGSNSKERILKACKSKGYYYVILCKDSKQKNCSVHRLVANAFIPNSDNLPEVNHIDEDKTNNACFNLEWCDRKYNMNFGTRTKRSAEKRSKSVLCIETGKIYPSINQVGRDLGISIGHISDACNGKIKTYKGFHWRYTE